MSVRLMILASLIARTHKHGDEELKRDVDLQRSGVLAQQRRRPRTYTVLSALTARYPAFNDTQARLPNVNARPEGCHAPKRYTSKAATAAPASAAFSSKKVTPGHAPLSDGPRKIILLLHTLLFATGAGAQTFFEVRQSHCPSEP